MQAIKKALKGTKIYEPLKSGKRKFDHVFRNGYCFFASKYYNSFILSSVVEKISSKAHNNEPLYIGFDVWNTSMWKYESLYHALEENSHFVPVIIMHPNPGQTLDVKHKALVQLIHYFNPDQYRVYKDVQWNGIDFEFDQDLKKKIDILFLTQLPNSYLPVHSLKDFLLCYCMYGFAIFCTKENQNRITDNILWKYFVESPVLIEEAKKVTFNKAQNRVYTGGVFGDILSKKGLNNRDPWKLTDKSKKRVIWAPHFSIRSDNIFHLSHFLGMSEYMMKIAEDYCEKIQFAFKPHPFLYTTLCKEECWGKERTDQYFSWWADKENCQLETGDYVDLFHTSDAIIHDSASFIIEYLFENKPGLYMDNKDNDHNPEDGFCTMAKEALKCYYRGSSEDDIRFFLNHIVLDEYDEIKSQREQYYQYYLTPPNGKTAAENIVMELERGLGIFNDECTSQQKQVDYQAAH